MDRPQSLPRHIYFCVHEGHKLNFDLLVLTNAMCTIHERLHQKCTRNGAYVVISLFFCNNYHHAKKWHSSWFIIWVNNWKKNSEIMLELWNIKRILWAWSPQEKWFLRHGIFFHFLANFLGIFEFDDFTNFLRFFCAFLEVHQPL